MEKVQPYIDRFDSQIYTPVAAFTKDKYATYGAHRVAQAQKYFSHDCLKRGIQWTGRGGIEWLKGPESILAVDDVYTCYSFILFLIFGPVNYFCGSTAQYINTMIMNDHLTLRRVLLSYLGWL